MSNCYTHSYFACLTFISYGQLLEHWKLRITCNSMEKPCDSCGQCGTLITERMGLGMCLLRCTLWFMVIFLTDCDDSKMFLSFQPFLFVVIEFE